MVDESGKLFCDRSNCSFVAGHSEKLFHAVAVIGHSSFGSWFMVYVEIRCLGCVYLSIISPVISDIITAVEWLAGAVLLYSFIVCVVNIYITIKSYQCQETGISAVLFDTWPTILPPCPVKDESIISNKTADFYCSFYVGMISLLCSCLSTQTYYNMIH